MKKSLKLQISKVLGGNLEINKKAIQMKRAWDEVDALINKGNKQKPKKWPIMQACIFWIVGGILLLGEINNKPG